MITFGIRQKSNDTWERRKKTFAPASMTELNYSHRLPRKKENKNWINSNMISNERINRLSGWQSALKGNILFFKAFRLAKLNGNKLKSTTNVLRTSTNETLFVEKETHPPFRVLFFSNFMSMAWGIFCLLSPIVIFLPLSGEGKQGTRSQGFESKSLSNKRLVESNTSQVLKSILTLRYPQPSQKELLGIGFMWKFPAIQEASLRKISCCVRCFRACRRWWIELFFQDAKPSWFSFCFTPPNQVSSSALTS